MGNARNNDVYERLDEDKFVQMGVVETISLGRLRRRLSEQEGLYNCPEPADDELIEYAKMTHPWYMERDTLRPNIAGLRALISKLESIPEVT